MQSLRLRHPVFLISTPHGTLTNMFRACSLPLVGNAVLQAKLFMMLSCCNAGNRHQWCR
jgi:hypothetical protein